MKRLRRIAITLTTVSALTLFILGNTALAKPVGGGPCVLVFEPPFTDKIFDLPLWMWGVVPFSVLFLSTLAAIGCWIAMFVKWWRSRRAQTAIANS